MKVREKSPGDIAELQRRMRQETKALQRDRYRAVLMALQAQEALEIAMTLGRARRSVQDWVYCYRDGGIDALLPGKQTGRPPKLPKAKEAELIARLDGGPHESDGVCTLRGKDVVRILESEFGVKYSLEAEGLPSAGVYDLLERLGYSCLSPRPRHEKNDPAAIADFKARAPFLSKR
jgi:putative transposase